MANQKQVRHTNKLMNYLISKGSNFKFNENILINITDFQVDCLDKVIVELHDMKLIKQVAKNIYSLNEVVY